jgi:regulator of protease activity HflC (stomatin/prohibitin superfamily)
MFTIIAGYNQLVRSISNDIPASVQVFIIVAVVVFLWVRKMVVIREGETAVVERFGKFDRMLTPGYYLLVPLIDRLRTVHWEFRVEDIDGGAYTDEFDGSVIEMRDRTFDPPSIDAITKDGTPVAINVVVQFRVIDARKAVYAVVDLWKAVEQVIITSITSAAAKNLLDDISINKNVLLASVDDRYKAKLAEWGVSITSVEIQDIELDDKISEATLSTIAARKTSEAELASKRARWEADVYEIQQRTSYERIKHVADLERAKAESDVAIMIERSRGEAYSQRRQLEADGDVAFYDTVGRNENTRKMHFESVRANAFMSVANKSTVVVMPMDAAVYAGLNLAMRATAATAARVTGGQ